MGKSLKLIEIIFYRHESWEGRLLLEYFGYLMIFGYLVMLLPIFILSLYFFEIIIALIVFLSYSCIHLLMYPKFKDYFNFEDL